MIRSNARNNERKVRLKITRLKNLVKHQFDYISELEVLINELKSPLTLYRQLEYVQCHYSILLNPLPKLIKASDAGMSEEYKISATDVICITSSTNNSRIKEIHLKSPFKTVKGDPKATKIIKVNRRKTIPEICIEIESSQVYLVNISQSAAVNADLYELVNDFVVLKLKSNNVKALNKLKISKKYIADFQAKKDALKSIRKFHKSDFSSILNI